MGGRAFCDVTASTRTSLVIAFYIAFSHGLTDLVTGYTPLPTPCVSSLFILQAATLIKYA